MTMTRPAPTPRLGGNVLTNLSVAELYERAIAADEGVIAADGPLVVRTGQHTGRSPRDKFIVREPSSASKVWWGEVNQELSEANYDRLRGRLMTYLADRELYAQDLYIGAHPDHRRSLRVYTETAWASVFARNLFRRPPREDLAAFEPNFTIINVPSFEADPATEGTRTGTAILLHLKRMEIIIVGTRYAGEIKKSAFTVMNYLMPDEGVLPMHSSINVGEGGDACIFFGLSGTGKTTLSADPLRSLIGDDEHGWGDGYTFNFEGGCYAKTIRLSPMYEPDIFATTKRFGTILENVDIDPLTRELDLDSERFTENTRAAYPLNYIGNADPTGIAARRAAHRVPDRGRVRGAAAHLAADPRAGRVPLHQRLHRQAGRHRGRRPGAHRDVLGRLRRPVPAAPPGRVRGDARRPPRAVRRPRVAREHRLDRRPVRDRRAHADRPHAQHGPRGDQRRARGRRRPSRTRSSGSRSRSASPGVPDAVLVPRATWADPIAYDAAARKLATMFHENFARYADGVSDAIRHAGPIEVHEDHGDIRMSAPGEG